MKIFKISNLALSAACRRCVFPTTPTPAAAASSPVLRLARPPHFSRPKAWRGDVCWKSLPRERQGREARRLYAAATASSPFSALPVRHSPAGPRPAERVGRQARRPPPPLLPPPAAAASTAAAPAAADASGPVLWLCFLPPHLDRLEPGAEICAGRACLESGSTGAAAAAAPADARVHV